MSRKLNKKGFTLIEVVLVLAIGGLIFLLAFLAFQQASTNRRDSQRRSDAARVISEYANARGDNVSITDQTTLDSFKTTYLNSLTVPGGTTTYTLTWKNTTTAVGNADNTMWVGANMVCNNNNAFTASTGNIAVIVDLEKGTACRDDE